MFNIDETLKKMQPKTHCYEVLNHFKSGKSITSMEAFKLFGITRLSAVIFTLKHSYNVPISSERLEYVAKNGRKVNFSKYYLAD